MKRYVTIALMLAACVAAVSAQQGPTPEMRARIDGVRTALTSFDPKSPAAVDQLREEAFTADFKKRMSAEQFRA